MDFLFFQLLFNFRSSWLQTSDSCPSHQVELKEKHIKGTKYNPHSEKKNYMRRKSTLTFFFLERNQLVSNIVQVCKIMVGSGITSDIIYHNYSQQEKLEAHRPSYQVQDMYLTARRHIFSYSLYCVTQFHKHFRGKTKQKKGFKAGKIKLNLQLLMFLNAAIQQCSLIQRSSY